MDNINTKYKVIFCTEYRHYKTGKIMKASDYGKSAWKFYVPCRKK